MNQDSELPEHQIFHVLRQGEEEPIGPYSQNQLVELLNEEQIHSYDYVFYPELTGWKRLSEVFNLHQQITNFADDGQEPSTVADSFALMSQQSLAGEEIYYIAVQKLPALSLTAAVRLTAPKSVVLTNRRFCIITPKVRGQFDFSEHAIDHIANAVRKIKSEGDDVGSFNIVLNNGEWSEIGKIPLVQLERLESIAADLMRKTA